MRVLVVNAGSSSLKLRFLGSDDEVLAAATFDAGAAETDAVVQFVEALESVDAVGHRVVHGGTDPRAAIRIDDQLQVAIEALTPLAPFHQAASLAGIQTIRRLLPHVPAVACFDTAFHVTLPAEAATYALPAEWRQRWNVRRFGFHGLSHAYAVRRGAEIVGRPGATDLRVVSCHLGAGASLCAALGGRSLDTTMGFTPLEGLVMATRAGSVDPGLVLWLITSGHLTPTEVTRGLEESSGLAGIGGGSGDMREILTGRRRGNAPAILAFDIYVHRLAREIAAMTAALGGLDVVVFTGGVGEHAHEVRTETTRRLAHLGLAIDHARNQATETQDRDVSLANASVRTLVIQAREDLEIAAHTRHELGPLSTS